MGYLCDTHPDTPGAVLITNLDTGDTAVLCGACVHPWALAIAEATAPAAEVVEVPDPGTGDPTHEDEAADPAPPVTDPTPADPEPTEEPAAPDEDDDQGDDLPSLGELTEERLAAREAAQEEAVRASAPA